MPCLFDRKLPQPTYGIRTQIKTLTLSLNNSVEAI